MKNLSDGAESCNDDDYILIPYVRMDVNLNKDPLSVILSILKMTDIIFFCLLTQGSAFKESCEFLKFGSFYTPRNIWLDIFYLNKNVTILTEYVFIIRTN